MKPRVREIFNRLLAFDTVSSQSNMALIEYVRDLLAVKGIDALIVKDETGLKANLFASTGPKDQPGILLSGHTDVVPVAGRARPCHRFRPPSATVGFTGAAVAT